MGDVNELLVDECNLISKGCGYMGLLLQEFYKLSSFLPFGFGMAGEAFESGQCRWASGEDLYMQIRFLSIQNQQPLPPELQALYFKTVVYIPLEKGAGVLEIGTKQLVPKSDSVIRYQIQRFINGLATQDTSMGDQIMGLSSSFEAGTKALPNDAGNQYEDPHGQSKGASMVEIYGGRPNICGHPSITSSYWSSSSTSSSTPSTSDQLGNNSNITYLLNTSPAQVSSMNNEDMLMSPASSLQDTPKSIVNSFDELHNLNQLDHIDMHGVSTLVSLPEFESYGLNNAEFTTFSHDHHLHLSNPSLYFSSTNVGSPSPPALSQPDNSRYLHPHSEPNTHHNHLLDYVLQPMQCALTARNDAQVDAQYHSLNEIVGELSKETTVACQIEVPSLPSVTCCQASSHSASDYRTDQQRQWRNMFPSINEGERMNDLLGQSKRHAHAMASGVLSKIPLAEDKLGLLEANIEHPIMQEQGIAFMIEDEASTSRNTKLIKCMSGTNSEGYEAFIGDKMPNDQGEKMVVSSTMKSTTQAAGRYVSYGSGSAEADKVVALSTSKAAGSCISYASGSAEAEKADGPGSYANYAYDSAEAYNAVGSSASWQATGSYVSYGSVSAEAEKVVGTPRESSMNPAQVHHVQAERKRRREQSECIKTLHTLLPKTTKKDKVSVLESTIRRLKELKDRIRELKEENSTLMNLSSEDQKRSSEDSSYNVSRSQHATRVKNSRQKISPQENATCDYVEGTMPHFRLSLIKNVPDVEANGTIIEIMNALQKKGLYSFEINSEFWTSTSKLSINILANYKDAGNHCPTLDEIHRVQQWWKHLLTKH